MPIYKNNGVTYNIPDDKAAGFEAKFPGAMVALENEGVKYELPVSKKKGFMEKFPGATYSVAAPPAPKAEDINPTSDKSGYAFIAEELGIPDNTYKAESTSVAKLPEIKPLGVPRVSMGAEEVADVQPLTTFGEGVKQGADALLQGGKYAVGELARVTDGSQRDYQEALKVMNSQNFDASTFDLDKALEDDARSRFEKEYADYRKVISQRRKEREGMGFFEGIKHKMDDPEMPTMKSARELGLKNLQHQKPLILVKEALEEAGGDAVKAREIIEEKAGREAWSDRTMREASEALDQHKPVEGWAWWGQLLPQTAGQAAALGANFIPVVGRYAGPALAYATTAGLTLSSAGSAMNEARKAGASDEDVFKAGLLQAIIEYGSEKIPLDRLMGRTGAAAFKKGYKDAVGDAAEEELERLLTTANKKLGGKLLSGKTAKALIKDMGVEGASEFVAEGLGTFVPIIYEDPENYPTLREALLNGWEGAKAGIAMGGFLGGGSLAITNSAHNARRKKQGHVVVAEDLENGVVEVLSEPDDKGVVEVLTQSGEVVQVDNGNLGPKSVFSYEEWKDGEIDTAINRKDLAYQEGYEAADEQKGALKQAYDMERERVLNTFGEEVVQKLDNDPIGTLVELNEVDRQEAIGYVNARTAYEGMIDRINADIDERVAASDKEIDSHKNKQDGMIHPAMMRGVNGAAPKRVYIVNGNVATFEDGTIDKANSSNMIIVRDAETGEVSAASADDLESLDAVIDTATEKRTVAEQIANEYAGQQAAIIETESAVADNTTDNVAPTGDNVAPAEAVPEEPVAMTALQQIPKDENNNPIYEQVDSELAWDAIVEEAGGSEELAMAAANSMVEDKKAALKKAEKAKAKAGVTIAEKIAAENERMANIEKAKADLAKWEEIAGVRTKRTLAQPVETVTEEEQQEVPAEKESPVVDKSINDVEDSFIDETAGEFIANQLAGIKITPESFAKETGLSKAEQKKLVGVISKNGVSVERAAEIILENYESELAGLGFTGDVQDVRDMIINILSQGNPRGYAKKSREARKADFVEQQRAQADAWAESIGFASYEDYMAYIETELERVIDKYQDFDETEYYNILAKNNEYDTKRESESVGRSGDVLQGEQPVPAGRGEDIAERLEGGEISNDVRGRNEDGAAQETPTNQNVEVTDSSSEIPNNQSVAEGDAPGNGSVLLSDEVANAEAEVNTTPTDAQKEAGNYKKGHVKIGPFNISIEQPKGSVRSGVDKDGKKWEVEMQNTYGYFRGTEGVDGDHIDVFLSNDIDGWNGRQVFVVDQRNADGSFDEHKVMLGFNDINDAEAAYMSNYEEGWQGLGAITGVSIEEFEKWISSSHRKTKAFAEYKNVKTDEGQSASADKDLRRKLADQEQSATNPSGNRLVTDERYAELRERMRKKLKGQMNIGVDPEILAIGTEMAVYHIEKGARKFADFAKGMIADLGDAIRPYLKAFYNGARELPEIEEAGFTKDMTPYEEVKTFDVANFDKQVVDAMATAKTVTRETEVAKDVEAVKAPKKRESAEGKKLRKSTQEDLEGNPVVYYKGEKHRILMLVHRGEQTSGARFTKPEITRVYLENMQDVKVDDLYVEDTRDNVGESGDNSVPSQQTPVNNLNENNDAREEITAADNSGAQPGREELPDTEQVGTGVPVQDTARNSRRKRRNTGVGSSKLGNGPQYDVNRNYTNEEIEEIVSSVTDIVDGKVVITGDVTDDIKAIVRGYESGGIAKKGRGILDEYYTDGKIVDAVNLLIAPYFSGSTPIRVLEPSVGIGNFIQAVNNIPTSEVVAFEINETTARIAKILYPDVDVNLRSFETEFIDESGNKKPMPQKYSLVIGNPPYGSHRGLYKGLGEESKIARYEDYFVKRSLDVLDEGGVLAMVLPSSWMDRHTKFGGYTIERAYRLPSGAFEATQVGTDIVILKKDSTVPVTEHAPYFEQFPERVLGEVKQRKGRYGRLEEYVEGDIDAAIEAIKKENAEQVADLLDIEKNNDALNDIESAVDETGSPEKAVAIVKDAQESEKADKKPAKKPSGKQGKYKVELNRGAETVPTSAQFTHEFSEGEVEAFADTDYEGALSNPAKHRRYANYIGGQAIHDFYYAEGDIYSKLAQLEQEKDYIVENYGAEQYEKQKALLESVLPKQKSLEEITISPNTTFVKNLNILTEGGRVSLKDMFVDFLRKLPRQAFGNSSPWEVVGYINNEQVHGTDKQRNQLIRERRKRVANDLFNKFLGEELSDNAKKQVVAAFNREYNSTYRPDYSKVPMFSTINRDFKGKPLKLTSVQLAGIGRMTVKGVGVLAHEVGFGKTLSGILAMHEAMTRGFAKKPLIVVPNDNILKQWVETIGEVLPNATVNTLGNLGAGYDLTDFKVNDGEFTIITYEGLKAMSFSDGTYNNLASKFSYITEDLNKHQSERDIQKEIEKKNELKGKMKRGTKSSYMFEDFGFDWLTVDEVHNANHIVSKVRLDKSVASDFRSQSQRTSDLGLKTWLAAQYIQEENNGRNVLLLSATPFTNKPLEYYSILSLVGNDMLERKGFFNVDQFFATFMEADNELEIGANGRPVQKTNVRRFRNNGLFQQLLSEFIDIKGEEDNPELVRPERLNKEYKIAQNELTAEAMAAAQELLSDNDTVLQGIGHARAAAFSPYATSLLGRQPKNHKEFVKNSPKIDATIKMIEQNIKDRPGAGQIVYSEVGVEYFPLIRDYLVKESGLKPNEVRIITGATSNNERVNIQTAFNNGEVKVVIGSPAIKEGLNLQGNTTDMYILSLPWNFTQLRQIEGRGWRQGNRWENIRINYMLTNDSVDVFMLQRLQLKQGLYNEAMKSGAESLDVSDIDTAELKTALITDPAVRAEIVTVQERAKLQQEKTQIEADLSFVVRKYEAYNKLVNKLDSQKNTVKLYKEWAQKGDEYWALRIPREEAQLANIENEIEEEKQNLLKKGVNVDDIVRQTEQAQNAIAAIQEKIDNLKEFQEELTQKFREESEAKAKEQGDLISTYIKERKAENKSFYKIRPAKSETKAAEEETEDDVLYRSAEDNEARAITYDEAVQIGNDFAKTHKGATKKMVFSKGAAEVEQQMRDAGFTELSIEVVLDNYKSGDLPTQSYLRSSDAIMFYEYPTDEELYSALWHENGHRAMRMIYGDDLSEVKRIFDNLPEGLKETFVEFLKSRNYAPEDYPKEAVTHFIEDVYRDGVFAGGSYDITHFFKGLEGGAMDFANFAQQIINYTRYGQKETRNNIGVDTGENVREQAQEWNAERREEGTGVAEATTGTAEATRGLTESEIALLEASTGYTREEIIDMFGYDLNREGAGPLTDREVVMESDVYSKVLGKPRYYGKKQREYVARMRAKMEQKANELAQKLHLDNVEVVTDTGMLEGKRKRAKGFYSKNTGKITIVIPNHSSVFDVERTVLHEAVAHHGLRQLFGKHFDTFLDNVFNNVTPEIRAEITELAKKHGWDFHTATEEYLASLAENTNFERINPSVWNRIKGFFMKMLAKAGLKLDFELNDNELRYILWRSYRNLAEPGSFRSILGEAADVAKQYELKVGNYAADTKQDTAAESDEDLYREGQEDETARERYERRVKTGMYQAQEALQDSMLGLKEAMMSILGPDFKGYIEDVPEFENAYIAENALSSINKAEVDAMANSKFKPLYDAVAKLALNEEQKQELIDYMFAKHGLERNEVMALRDAVAHVKNLKKDIKNQLNKKTLTDEQRANLERAIALIDAQLNGVVNSLPPAEAQKWYDGKKYSLDKQLQEGSITQQVYNRKLKELGIIYNEGFVGLNRRTDYAGLTALTKEADVVKAEAEARKMVEEYEAAHDTADLWGKVKAVNDAILRKQFVCGLMSKETYDKISSMYQYYIPLRGFAEETSADAYAYLNDSKSGFSAPIKTARGRKSKADDPFANLEAMAESAIMQGNRNRLVKQRFLNFVMRHRSDLASVSELWLKYNEVKNEWEVALPDNIEDTDSPEDVERKVAEFEKRMEELAEANPELYKRGKDAENIPYRVVQDAQKQQHQVIVKRAGKPYVITINGNPRAAQAINGQTNPDNDLTGAIGAVFKEMERLNRFLSDAYTTKNPDFMISNFWRDTLFSNIMTWIKESPVYAWKFNRNFLKVNPKKMKSLYKKYREGTLDMNNEIERMFKDFIMNGGETGYSNLRDMEQRKKDVEKAIAKAAKGGEVTDVLVVAFEEMSKAVENCSRFAAFMTSRQLGRNMARSVYDAKEVSVNFNKKGAGAKFMSKEGQTFIGNSAAFISGFGRAFYVFWNAAIQGTTNFGRQFKRHPVKTVGTAFAMFVLGAIMAALGDDDEDDKNAYYNLPEYVRRSNILFRVGDSWVSIPLPVEFRTLYGAGELMASVLGGKQHYTTGELAEQVMGIVSQVLPLDIVGDGGLKALIPSAARPLTDAYVSNESWTGLPIYKDNDFNKDDPEWTKAYSGTNRYLVGLAEKLNEWTGGDKYMKGTININPARVEYLLEQYFGGYTSTVDKLVKTTEMMFGKREYSPNFIPLWNRMVKAGDERTEFRAVTNEYYRLKDEYKATKGRLNGYENEADLGALEYAEKLDFLNNSPEYVRYEIFETYRRDIEDLEEEIKELKDEKADEKEIKGVEIELTLLRKEMIEEMKRTYK